MRALVQADAAGRPDGSGRVLHRYESFALVETAGAPDDADREPLNDTAVSVHGRPVEIPEGSFPAHGEPHTLVRMIGPIAHEWRTALARRGVRVLFWCPRFGACLRLPEGLGVHDLPGVFPFIAGAAPYRAEHCRRDVPAPGPAPRGLAGTEARPPGGLVDVVAFGGDDRARVEAELRQRGVPIVATSSSKLRVRSEDVSALRDVVGVKIADRARAPVLLAASPLAQALAVADAAGDWMSGLDGSGEIVAVADTGLDRGVAGDALHQDFRGRIRRISSWPINASWSSLVTHPTHDDGGADIGSGHGTHVAGVAVGDGSLSGGVHRGIAPGARLVFQAIEQFTETAPAHRAEHPPGFYLSGRPLDLRDLFREARELGARVHVNAWGDPARGAYTDDCFEADAFLREHQDAVILFAAGNDGTDRDGNRAVDPRSLYAPASAKNVIAVGATEGPIQGVGLLGRWGDTDRERRRCRNEADRADPISGEPDRLALLSSAGPTADGRIKPDVCAPGTNIAGPRSSATQARGWGLADPLPHYMYLGGTSIATAVAAGAATVVRRAWRTFRGGKAPSGPALKALLVLGARPVRARGGPPAAARDASGFGRIQVAASLPDAPGTTIRLHDETEPGLLTGEEARHPVTMTQTGPFKAVLAWYDAPGERLVNDLDLCLVDERGTPVWGNHLDGQAAQPDRSNTVEVVSIPALPSGRYVLKVVAVNVPEPPQPYALVMALPKTATPGVPGVPVDALRGVGRRTTARLGAQGITELGALLRSTPEELARVTGLGQAGVRTLHSKLVLIDQVVSRGVDDAVPRSLTLAAVRRGTAPAGVAAAIWERTRRELAPLDLVFDTTRLSRISLGMLFR